MARLDDLRALSELLWSSLEVCDAEKRAPLAAQYRATLTELAELEKQASKVGDPVDEIAARRAARGGSTARGSRATGVAG